MLFVLPIILLFNQLMLICRKRFSYLMTGFLLLMTAPLSATECAIQANLLGAKYRITTQDLASMQENNSYSHFNLWRWRNKVAHQKPEQHITEVWHLLNHQQAQPIRYFDQHRRGIEYQPLILMQDWLQKYQLVTQDTMDQIELISTEGNGCDERLKYQFITEEQQLFLDWDPTLQLFYQFRQVTPHNITIWALEELVSDPYLVRSQFLYRHDYLVIPAAKVGRTVNDSFLSKMMHLDFLDYGVNIPL